MRQLAVQLLESALLLGGLFFTVPYVPSNELERLPLFPTGGFAVILFAFSRAMRWRRQLTMIALETVCFAAFVWVANMVANLLYSL
jgi:hypothetical protein